MFNGSVVSGKRFVRKVYLDHAATTPLDPAVLDAMLEAGGEVFGNPSSGHLFGRRARALLDEARERVAVAIGARRADEILFTSGGTEADNLALVGALEALEDGAALAVGAAEHAAVLDPAAALERRGRRVVRLPVDEAGRTTPESLDEALAAHPAVGLVSLIWANNELGRVNDVAALSAVCRRRGALLHSDAVQALGRLAVRVDETPVDLLSGSAHKFHGPKGAGFLYVRRGVRVEPLILGGLQQEGRRGGTENLLGAIGLATALELAVQRRDEDGRRLREQSRRFAERLAAIPGLAINTDGQELPGHFSLTLPDVDGETLLLNLDLDGIAVSSGSACHTGLTEPSHVLLAAGFAPREAKGTIRLVLGRTTSDEDLDWAAERLARHAADLRGTQ